jgi:hypothetical protein
LKMPVHFAAHSRQPMVVRLMFTGNNTGERITRFFSSAVVGVVGEELAWLTNNQAQSYTYQDPGRCVAIMSVSICS